ncbi:MAG TPA: outer membrane beta-barrel protein [Vicinamibacterales bacterium]|nr:outer membrane beta-barrel protein [Vicinamibacterales bacterium]
MTRRVLKALILTAVVAGVAAPSQARAEGYVSPWAGIAFGTNASNSRGMFGVDAGGMGAGIIGGEVDFGYSPSFFGTQNDFGHNTVIDVMGNVIVGVPIGGTHGPGVRPFVTGGVGLLRTQIDGGTIAQVSSSNNMFGWNLGAGVMGYFAEHFGLRGDIRYLRGFKDLNTGVNNFGVDNGQLHLWRASIGLVFR